MTSLLDAPPRPADDAPPRRGGLVLSAGLAAAGAAAGSLVVVTLLVLLVWFSDGRGGSSAGEAVATSVQGWLLLHGAPLDVPGGMLGLTPWGLAVVPGLLLHRAGARLAAGQESPVGAARAVAALAAVYALVGVVGAGFAATTAVQPTLLGSMLACGLFAAVLAGSGALRVTGRPSWPARVPLTVRQVAVAGARAAGVLLVGAVVLVGLAVLVSLGDAVAVGSLLEPGFVGGVALVLLCVGLLPTAVVMGLAYLVGTGFALGAGTSVGPFGVSTQPLPALPLLAAVPTGGAPGWLLPLLVLPVLAAGVGAGVTLHRRLGPADLRARLVAAAGAGAVAGVLVAVLCVLAAGPVGGGLLAQVGPTAWSTGLVVAVEVTLLALATLLLGSRPRVASAATVLAAVVSTRVPRPPRRRSAGAGTDAQD